ncbi:serine/threonine-protein kinase [Nocardioides marmotae]|uniref:serine/threonine-protein kinase n=1 Tax=Nocardioides marmotae TaxID=2663857 RepID=UPI0012B61C08|nr:serine/threonine-protein kinase [Nocardioides marmotae]MBC9732577.1 serine/threonine protein kinase [Nocardioides marmotae]MTB83696.1 protein kinase [Nocardioides marmotae]
MTKDAEDGGYPEVGERLGPYMLGARIGSGGMGWVYEALDTRLHRQVAVKVIAPQLAGDAGFRDRFVREAQAQASLDSPHVVHVYDHGEVDGRLYLVTQHIPDGDLADALRTHGAPPLEAAVDIVAQVAAGLADVHAAGFVHRDVKPSNVLLRRREDGVTAYLGDFGIVREADADHTATAAGTAGTPDFMAPELHTGAKASARTDVYSLGCLLWTTLTGSPPYSGASEWELVTAHREQPVPRLPGEGPVVEGVNRVLATGMAKDPAERYADARPLREDLRDLLRLPAGGPVVPVDAVDPPAAAPLPPPPHARRRLVALVAAILVLAVVGVVAWALTWGEEDDEATGGAPSLDRGRAVASVAAAFEEQLGEAAARSGIAVCMAEHWVDGTGLSQLRADGFLTEDSTFVDRPSAEMTDQMRAAVAAALTACVGAAGDG